MIGLISDIHGNIEALNAVLADGAEVQEWLCAGDIVGYGADPGLCIDRLRELNVSAVSGNHDEAALLAAAPASFRTDAVEALKYTRSTLGRGQTEWLRALPASRLTGDVFVSHDGSGGLSMPLMPLSAPAFAPPHSARIHIFGHTHFSALGIEQVYGLLGNKRAWTVAQPILGTVHCNRSGTGRIFVNPGSVGQPRDGDPRAGYALLDQDSLTVTFRRVEYDVCKTCEKLRHAFSNSGLAERLLKGR